MGTSLSPSVCVDTIGALIAAVALTVSGCAYVPLPRGVADLNSSIVRHRNRVQRKRARWRLEAKGYTFISRSRNRHFFAFQDQEDFEDCVSLKRSHLRSPPNGRSEQGEVDVNIQRPDDASPRRVTATIWRFQSRFTVNLPLVEACNVYYGFVRRLDVESMSGERLTIHRVPAGEDVQLARNPAGELVFVRFERRIIKRHDMLILGTCHRGPTPPVEHSMTPVGVYLGEERPHMGPTVEVPTEAVEVRCTRVVW